MSRVGPSVIASALLAALTLAAAACDGGKAKSEAQKDAEDHVRAVFAAFNEKDGETFIAGWTDAGFEKQFGGLKRHLAEVFPGFVSIHEFTIESFPAPIATSCIRVFGLAKELHGLRRTRFKGLGQRCPAPESEGLFCSILDAQVGGRLLIGVAASRHHQK